MKKVLIISASPRKNGNMATLYARFAQGAQESGNIVEREFLAEKNIEYCSGCDRCSGTKRCIKNDDMRRILERMMRADVIVLATPVEFYSMDAQMKKLLDRMQPRYEELAEKEFYVILTSQHVERKELERVMESFRSFIKEKLGRAGEAGCILGADEKKTARIKDTAAYEEAYQMGLGV